MRQNRLPRDCQSENVNRFPSEAAERFQIRLPEGMRERIRSAAAASGRSMNTEIVRRLRDSFGEPSIEFQADDEQKQNGPAEAATSPSHGSSNPITEKSANERSNTTANVWPASESDLDWCPVFCLLQELEDARSEYSRLDEASGIAARDGQKARALHFRNAATHWLHVEHAVCGLIAASEAKSVLGACIQIMEALQQVDLLADAVRDGGNSKDIQRPHESLQRLLYSIMSVLRRRSEWPLDDVLDPAFWARNCDPWNTFGEIAALKLDAEPGA